jgi:threonine/homoserine/homoserine lactone efflux protein
MSIESLLALLLVSVIAKITPGPGVFATAAQSMTYGFRSALSFISGIMVGDLVYILAVVLGLSVIAREFNEIFFVIRLIGGGYLIYLGYKAFTSSVTLETQPRTHGSKRAMLNGFLLTLGNPKVILFYVGLMPTFIDLTVLDGFDMMVLCTVLTLDLGCILAIYAYGAVRARQLFKSAKAMRRMNRGAGVVLAGSGVAVITTS